jgi:hypothetical protein
MATLALAAAAIGGIAAAGGAAAVGGTIAVTAITMAATTIGSIIDNAFLFPALFPQDDVEGPRLSDGIRLQSTDEGSPTNIGVGNRVRTAGTVIWISDLIEESREEGGGGGKGFGGGGGSYTVYSYYCSLAVCFARTGGDPITGVREILANGKVIYRDPTPITVVGTMDCAPELVATAGAIGTTSGGMAVITYSGGTDLDQFFVGQEVVVVGFSNPVNNGTFEVLSATSDAGAGTSRLKVRNPNAVAETGGSANLSQTPDAFDPATAVDIAIYHGDTSQSPDPLIQSYQGAGQVPAWRGFAYFRIERLALDLFGNTVPQFNVIWNPGTAANAGGMMQTISTTHARMDAGFLDTSGATDSVDGYSLAGSANLKQAFQPLFLAYDLVAQTDGDGLRVFKREDALVLDVDPEDLASAEDGRVASERRLVVKDQPELRLPSSVSVKYLDKENAVQSGSQRETARVGGTPGTELSVNLPLVLAGAGAEARAIAKRVLYQSFITRQTVDLSLPPKYAYIQENDVLRIPRVMDKDWLLRVTKVDQGVSGLIQIEAVHELREAMTQTGVAEPPTTGETQDVGTPTPVVGLTIDPPTIIPPRQPDPGTPTTPVEPPYILSAVVVPQPGRFFPGAEVWWKRQDEDEESYAYIGSHAAEARIGVAQTALGGSPATGLYRDDVNTVDIEVYTGALFSATDGLKSILNGANLAILGPEVIAFETATLIDTSTFRLSGLWRGLGGTGGEIDSHVSGEAFLLLSGPGIVAFGLPQTALGVPIHVKQRTPGEDLADVPEIATTIEDGGMKPAAPVNVFTNRSGSGGDAGDTTIRWDRVGKTASRIFGDASVPLAPFPSELYEVEIRNASGDVVRTVSTSSTSLVYTFAEQASDLIDLVDSFDVEVFQVNTDYGGSGRGYGSGRVTVAGV